MSLALPERRDFWVDLEPMVTTQDPELAKSRSFFIRTSQLALTIEENVIFLPLPDFMTSASREDSVSPLFFVLAILFERSVGGVTE